MARSAIEAGAGNLIIKFDTDKLIIIRYPHFAGGKFLMNCLGLSNNATLQDCGLTVQQLHGTFLQQEKINYLHSKLNNITKEWNDLNLGCYQLFDVPNESYLYKQSNIIQETFNFHPVIKQLTDSNTHYFFLAAHSDQLLESYLGVWPNAQIIEFTNYNNFCNFRNHTVASNYTSIHRTNCSFVWDCEWYFDTDQTIDKIKELYTILNLPDFNETEIRRYHETWLYTLTKLKLAELNK